jgi:hypothetical protein
MSKTYTSAAVANHLGISKARLITTINRHPHLKPIVLFGQNLVWTEAQLEAVKSHLTTNNKRGRPRK